MPTYEYECKSCAHKFEAFQSMSDDPLKVCPECGKEVRRLIGGGMGVIFKGSGFYVTDNRSGSGKSSGNGSGNDSSDTKKSTENKPKTESSDGGSSKSKEKVKG